MAKLPTKKELEQLYREKGHDALVWYAWRCALRVLPHLGADSLSKTWPDDTVKYVYEVIQPYLVLAQWLDSSKAKKTNFAYDSGSSANINANDDVTNATKIAIEAATIEAFAANWAAEAVSAAQLANAEAKAAALSAVKVKLAADKAKKAAAMETEGKYSKKLYDTGCVSIGGPFDDDFHIIKELTSAEKNSIRLARQAVEAVNKAEAKASNVSSEDDVKSASDRRNTIARIAAISKVVGVSSIYQTAAKSDFSFLKTQEIIDKAFWHNYPLWPKKLIRGSSEPVEFRRYRKNLVVELDNLGLGFLAKDVESLWSMGQGEGTLGAHVDNYQRDLSDTVLKDPVALRQAILGGKGAAEKLQTVRVLLLGPGGAGKSSLRDRLLGRSIVKSINRDATVGVEYEWLDQSVLRDLNPNLKLDTQLDLRLWDFGGQTIFHGLHSAFLHENCVYVLVVDSRHEQAPDNWLYQIRDLTQNNPHVLIVTNRYDHCDTKQNETRLIREFPDLLKSTDQFFYFSCHQSDETAFKDFIQELVNQSMNSRHQVLKLAMDVQRKMQVEFEGKVFLEALHIEDLIPEHLVEKFHATVINHLDQLGYMIPVTKGGTNYCLKPEWAVKHAYDLVHSKALRDAKASASKITLQRMLKKEISLEEANFLIQFLESHHLCQKLDNDEYFFPDSAPANEPVSVHEIQNEKEALALRFDLPFRD